MGRRGYPPEFRRKVVDLVASGRPIAEVAQVLGISAGSILTRCGRLLGPPSGRLARYQRSAAAVSSPLQRLREARSHLDDLVHHAARSRASATITDPGRPARSWSTPKDHRAPERRTADPSA